MLTAGRNTPYRDADLVSLQVAAGNKIYSGAIVMLDANGFAIGGKTAVGLTYVGRAESTIDNAAGANGAKSINVLRRKAFKWGNLTSDLITTADLFKTAYAVDDETVARTSNANARSPVGKIIGIEADGVWIE